MRDEGKGLRRMQTQVLAIQLELDLWQNLKTARDEPETADIKQLWQELEQVIEQSELDQQLRVSRRCDRIDCRGLRNPCQCHTL